MQRKVLIAGLLVYVSCALSHDRPPAPPPPFIKAQIRNVHIQGVCLLAQDSVNVYTTPNGAGFNAVMTRATTGVRVYVDVPVHVENCLDVSPAWPDVAAAEVQAAMSPTGAPYAQLVIGSPALNQCQLHVDLPLLPPGGTSCAPLNPGLWANCGCPQIYTDFKAP
jgi:hypothetical protein